MWACKERGVGTVLEAEGLSSNPITGTNFLAAPFNSASLPVSLFVNPTSLPGAVAALLVAKGRGSGERRQGRDPALTCRPSGLFCGL